MKSVLVAPRKYVQGRGVLGETGAYAALLGKRPLLLWDAAVRELFGQAVLESMRRAGLEAVEAEFRGESTREEASRIAEIMRQQEVEVCVGLGGGKTLDCAKAAAHEAGTKLLIVPTLASTDAPTSALSMWYNDQGDCTGYSCWPFNPDIVLVDSEVVARAPVRSFVAGMGDALATWLEARAAFKSRAVALAGGTPTMAALALAKLCYDTLLAQGVQAKQAIEQHCVTPSVEKVIEANVLLSGLGFESGGLATAHMIANALPTLPECKGFMHGEKVGFGIVCQMCLDEDTDVDEMNRILDFEIAVGLPVTLAELNLAEAGRDKLGVIGRACEGPDSLCANHVFSVTCESVVDAMFAADAVGRRRKALS